MPLTWRNLRKWGGERDFRCSSSESKRLKPVKECEWEADALTSDLDSAVPEFNLSRAKAEFWKMYAEGLLDGAGYDHLKIYSADGPAVSATDANVVRSDMAHGGAWLVYVDLRCNAASDRYLICVSSDARKVLNHHPVKENLD